MTIVVILLYLTTSVLAHIYSLCMLQLLYNSRCYTVDVTKYTYWWVVHWDARGSSDKFFGLNFKYFT